MKARSTFFGLSSELLNARAKEFRAIAASAQLSSLARSMLKLALRCEELAIRLNCHPCSDAGRWVIVWERQGEAFVASVVALFGAAEFLLTVGRKPDRQWAWAISRPEKWRVRLSNGTANTVQEAMREAEQAIEGHVSS